MFQHSVRRLVTSRFALRLAVPLAAAILAALASHVMIDVTGDYLLAHDAYDDHAHGSRWLASIALGVSSLGVFWVFVRAVLAETQGHRGALQTMLRASVPGSVLTFALMVTACAFPLLMGMACIDQCFAGVPLRTVADLLGGSFVLGTAITLASAIGSAVVVHRIIALATRFHRSIIRAVTTLVYGVRAMHGEICALVLACRRDDRPRVPAALARCTRDDRAPPKTATIPLPA